MNLGHGKGRLGAAKLAWLFGILIWSHVIADVPELGRKRWSHLQLRWDLVGRAVKSYLFDVSGQEKVVSVSKMAISIAHESSNQLWFEEILETFHEARDMFIAVVKADMPQNERLETAQSPEKWEDFLGKFSEKEPKLHYRDISAKRNNVVYGINRIEELKKYLDYMEFVDHKALASSWEYWAKQVEAFLEASSTKVVTSLELPGHIVINDTRHSPDTSLAVAVTKFFGKILREDPSSPKIMSGPKDWLRVPQTDKNPGEASRSTFLYVTSSEVMVSPALVLAQNFSKLWFPQMIDEICSDYEGVLQKTISSIHECKRIKDPLDTSQLASFQREFLEFNLDVVLRLYIFLIFNPLYE